MKRQPIFCGKDLIMALLLVAMLPMWQQAIGDFLFVLNGRKATIVVDYDRPVAEALEAARVRDSCHLVTSENLAAVVSRRQEGRAEIVIKPVRIPLSVTVEEARQWLTTAGWQPATLPEILAYAEWNNRAQHWRGLAVAIGSTIPDDEVQGLQRFPALQAYGPIMQMRCFDASEGGWASGTVFWGVRIIRRL